MDQGAGKGLVLAATGAEAVQGTVWEATAGSASLAPRRSSAHAGMAVAQSRWASLWYSPGGLKHKRVKRFLWSQPSIWSHSQELNPHFCRFHQSISQLLRFFFLISTAKKCTETYLCVISINQAVSPWGGNAQWKVMDCRTSLLQSPRVQLWPRAAPLPFQGREMPALVWFPWDWCL